MNRFTHQQGFTLLQLLIGITLSSILLSIAVPSFSYLSAKTSIESFTSSTIRAWEFARSEAISTGKPVTLCGGEDLACSPTWNNQIYIFHDADFDNQPSAEELLHVVYFDSSQVMVHSKFALGIKYIKFNTRGHPNVNGSFIFCPNNEDRHLLDRISWNHSGRIYKARSKDKSGIITSSSGESIDC